MQFEEFLDSEPASLTRFAGVLCGERHLAHDVLANALLNASARWTRIGRMEFPAAYCRQIVVTTYLALRRRESRRRTDLIAVPDIAVVDQSETIDNRDLLEGLLRSLPGRQRAAVVLRFYLDLDDKSIAAITGISVNGVRSNISRALATLRARPEMKSSRSRHE